MGTTIADPGFIKTKIKPSKNRFQSVYEALSNSLEANHGNNIQIVITFHFQPNSPTNLQQIDIVDNGNGFTDEDCDRFVKWGDKSKKKNNRGSGRMQFYHDFKEVEIESIFRDCDSNTMKKRTFTADSTNFIEREAMKSEIVNFLSPEQITTRVSLKTYQGKDKNIHCLTIDEFVDSIRSNLLLRFYLEKRGSKRIHIKVEFEKNGEIESKELSNDEIQQPDKEGCFDIFYEKVKYSDNKAVFEKNEKKESIKWAYFEVKNSRSKDNEIKICSKDIPVQEFLYENLNKDCKATQKKYLTVFYGDILDEPKNVNDSIDGFTFPRKSEKKENYRTPDLPYEEEETEFLFFDTIEEEIKNVIPNIYIGIKEQKDEKDAEAKEIAKEFGINPAYVEKTDIKISDDRKIIAEKLYKEEAKELSRCAIKTKEIDDRLCSVKPGDENYESDLCNLMEERLKLTTEQDRAELSKYVIRRNLITKLLQIILNDELHYQQTDQKRKDKEGIIHDLFFKRRTVKPDLSDLWLLNEDFIYYHGYSDTPLSKIKLPDGQPFFDTGDFTENDKLLLERRPDIYLFAEEKACIIVEFKNKDENLADHVQQVIKYCGIIANYGKLEIKKFFCYLIGEKLIEKDLESAYKKTVYGDMSRNFSISANNEFRNPIADGQLEIIKLSSLEKRSNSRNRIFAKKLGLETVDY
jgi:hypothetical protein